MEEFMKKKSITVNAILNGVRNVLNIFFPLITFPYASRVLGVNNMGNYNFAVSIVTYFSLIAMLGINTYGVREGTQYRNDKKSFSKFASDVLTINLISTLASYILMFFCIAFIGKLQAVKELIIVLSIQIVFTTFGVEWIYSVYEDYLYITVRSVLFKIISIICLFIFVRSGKDTIAYAIVTLIASVGSNVLNIINAKKYFSYKFTLKIDYKKHLFPILTMFASTVAIQIYVSSDTTMLGFLKDSHAVGIYSVSSKIYSSLKSVLAAVLIVSIPRLSYYSKKNFMKEFQSAVQKVVDTISVLLLPSLFALVILSKNIVYIVGGKNFIRSQSSFIILVFALLFCMYGWIYNECVMIPLGEEKLVMITSIVSALVNISLNFILIPEFSENAAAFTTVISELIMLIVFKRKSKVYCKIRILNKNNLKSLLASIFVAIICYICNMLIHNIIKSFIISFVISIIVYFIMLLLLKHNIAIEYMVKMKEKIS